MGECTGLVTVSEWGRAETPVFLTSTMQVGRVYDAACLLLAKRDPRVGVEDVVIPLVAECDDSGLSDPRRARLSDAEVASAWDAAIAAAAVSGTAAAVPPLEGSIGAGTGMECLGWKGGVGTASRLLPSGHVLAAVVLANFGEAERLTVAGVPVGRLLAAPEAGDGDPTGSRGAIGSCIVVLVTDAPIDAHGCRGSRPGPGSGWPGPVPTPGMDPERSSSPWPRAFAGTGPGPPPAARSAAASSIRISPPRSRRPRRP